MSRSEMIERIMELQEQKRYSAFDIDEFAEWCRIKGFFYEVDNKIWCNYYTEPITEKTTAQLREIWEKESKVCGYCKGEGWIEEPLRTIPCPACGGTKIGEATE